LALSVHHATTHFAGSAVLFAAAGHLPEASSLIAAIAAVGLLLSGVAQVAKQAVEIWRIAKAARPKPPEREPHGTP
jgi:hypothetical protein